MEKTIQQRKMQAFTVSKDSAGNSTDQVNLDTSYDRCIGAIFTEVDGSDVLDYSIGLDSGGRTIVEPVNAKALQVDRSVSVNDRIVPLDFSPKSSTDIITQVGSAPTGTLKYQVVFILVKYAEC